MKESIEKILNSNTDECEKTGNTMIQTLRKLD